MISDPIADMLTRIKNAYLAHQQMVKVPYSQVKEGIGKILVKEGYLKSSKLKTRATVRAFGDARQNSKPKYIVCKLGYREGKPIFEDFARVSKPGRRIYARWYRIPQTLSGFGTTIVSTSKGMMTDKEAKKKKLGGEVICKVW